uniref:Small ribosomal subunit protein uS8c n=1 Tax=Eustrephus latifolius TaxID=101708 RepID=A0A0U1XDG4_EUSLA|nr:ribosomal protein S8 [Eustrephus latifolius]AIR12575.1 ribosomal protein S8 [Eustrephus latifolius]
MNQDTIASMITSIRNSEMTKSGTVRIPSTKITETLAKIFLREGFIKNVRKHQESNKHFLVLSLRRKKERTTKRIYRNQTIFKRISRPGVRVYSNYQKIPKILGGMGIVILSSSKGLITDREAITWKIGGEIICVLY